jgi:hypothetical protein
MSYETYKILHLIGLVILFISLGALAYVPLEKRKPLMALNGLASVIMLVAGFGLLARLGLARDMGTWVYIKIVIWLVLSATPVILRKKPTLAMPVLLGSIALGTLAAYLAIMKPGA